jgi:hypothetical protein
LLATLLCVLLPTPIFLDRGQGRRCLAEWRPETKIPKSGDDCTLFTAGVALDQYLAVSAFAN